MRNFLLLTLFALLPFHASAQRQLEEMEAGERQFYLTFAQSREALAKGDTLAAARLQWQAANGVAAEWGSTSLQYANSLLEAAHQNIKAGTPLESDAMLRLALKIYEQNIDDSASSQALILAMLGEVELICQRPNTALHCLAQSRERLGMEAEAWDVQPYTELGEYLSTAGHLRRKARAEWQKGMLSQAKATLLQAQRESVARHGTESMDNLLCCSLLGDLCTAMGDEAGAQDMGREVMRIGAILQGGATTADAPEGAADAPEGATDAYQALMQRGLQHLAEGKTPEAVEDFSSAAIQSMQVLNYEHYLRACYMMLTGLMQLREFQNVADLVKMMEPADFVNLYPSLWCEILTLRYLALTSVPSTPAETLLEAVQQAAEVRRRAEGALSPTLCTFYAHEAQVQAQMGRMDDATESLQRVLDGCRDIVQRRFPFMTAAERTTFWNSLSTVQQNVYRLAEGSGIERLQRTPDATPEQLSRHFAPVVYDTALLSGGLLLETTTRIAATALHHPSQEVRTLFADLQTSLPDTLRQAKEVQLMSLLADSAAAFTRGMSVAWQDVRDALRKDEAAVEFVRYATPDDSVAYCALTLRRGDEAPAFTPLFRVAPDDEDFWQRLLDGAECQRLVWQPIAERLKRAKHVHFSPTGRLCTVPIEVLTDLPQTFHRVSSTRRLALPKEASGEGITLYGGIVYEPAAPTGAEVPASGASAEGDDGTRGAVQRFLFLPGTLAEVQGVAALLPGARLLTGHDATAASLKALSGRRTRLLHIATHGYAVRSAASEVQASAPGVQRHGIAQVSALQEEEALARCGLVMADGERLTAGEIAALDLRGMDLVVLSACETGQGLASSDGVVGLQRGFKRAGAGSLLMSLWRVDDAATDLLMRTFYGALSGGATAARALDAARAKVRQAHPDPRFWAAFVLLD